MAGSDAVEQAAHGLEFPDGLVYLSPLGHGQGLPTRGRRSGLAHASHELALFIEPEAAAARELDHGNIVCGIGWINAPGRLAAWFGQQPKASVVAKR